MKPRAVFHTGGPGCAPSLSQPLMRAGLVDAHISRSLFGAFGVDETMKPLAVFHTGGPGCAPSLSQPLMRAGLVDAHISRSLFGAFGVDETMKPLAVFHTGGPGGGFTYSEAFDKDEPGREREFPEASHAGELPSRLNGSRCSGSEGERLSGGTGFAFGEYGIDLMGICENIDKFTMFFDKFLKNNFEPTGIKNLLFQLLIRILSAPTVKNSTFFAHIFSLARISPHSPA